MNWIIKVLQLCLIIPAGRFKLLDRIGLTLWTGFGIAVATAYAYDNWENITAMLGSQQMYLYFILVATVLNPALTLVTTFPAVHFLVLNSPIIGSGNANYCFDHKLTFCLDVLLAILSCGAYILQFADFEFGLSYVASIIFSVATYTMMIITSFILGFATSSLKNNSDVTQDYKVSASRKLQDFIKLKAGCSLLIFNVYAFKTTTLTLHSVMLLTGFMRSVFPVYMDVCVIAYAVTDIFYVNTIVADAYHYIQHLILKLRCRT